MILVKTKKELQEQLNAISCGGTIGFVPTMGALHPGHLSLVKQAAHDNCVVVVSIFVNPTQFNDPADLARYPRNLEADLEMLEGTGCDLVYAPEPGDIYPEPDTRQFDFGLPGQVMEGKHRPGHFNGVAQVVSRLFGIIKPDKAYFGLKDFQQLAVIRIVVRLLELPVEIVPCPVVREKNGLAMSSRNELLTPRQRESAALIYETISRARNLKGKKSVEQLINWVKTTINSNPDLVMEYFEVVENETLQPVMDWNKNKDITGCIAVYCGNVRLIDTIAFN